jgi:hypothetical protein
MMAKTGTGGAAGEWTAGLIAILATVLIGAAIPIALYFTLYVPRTEAHASVKQKLVTEEARELTLSIKAAKVAGLKKDADGLVARLASAEDKFTPTELVAQVVKRLSNLAVEHKLGLRKEQQTLIGAKVVNESGAPVIMAGGLRGVQVAVVGQARYHDLCRFIAEVESQASGINNAKQPPEEEKPEGAEETPESADEKAVREKAEKAAEVNRILRNALIIVESLSMLGDQNGGHNHNFELRLVIVERRNIEAVGVGK